MAKTPVSILQEMSAKLSISPPHYELIQSRPEGVNPEFKFAVSFNGVVAVGTGRSKKEAKHNAAEMAITKLSQQQVERQLPDTLILLRSHGEPVASPFNSQVTRNYVGELAELCATNQLPAPLYNEVMAEGPSHAPSFTLSCCVSQFTETAQASTKKQAKHCVAKKMLARVEECLLSKNFKSTLSSAIQNEEPRAAKTARRADENQDKKAKVLAMKALRQQLIIPTINNSRPIDELHLVLEEKYAAAPPKLLIDSRQDKNSPEWNPYVRVQKLAEEMGVSCYVNIKAVNRNFIFSDDNYIDDSDEDMSYYLYVSEADKESMAPKVIECRTDNNTEEEWDTDSAEYIVKLFLVTSPLSVVFAHCSGLREAKKRAAEKMIAHLERMILGLPEFDFSESFYIQKELPII